MSVVIPTRDKVDRLRLTLGGLATQSYQRFDIVVVDDGSIDGTGAMLAAHRPAGPPLHVVHRGGVGRAGARNAGAAAAGGDLLLFLDDDILTPPDFVAAHVRAHRDTTAAVALGPRRDGERVVHGPLRELPGSARLVADAPDDPYAAAMSRRYGRTVVNSLERLIRDMAEGLLPAPVPWAACVGANVSLPRATWRRLGGFDEGYGQVWGCEDLEFGYRLHAAGAAFRYAAEADGVHLSHARPARWDEHEANLRRFHDRHPDPAVAALSELLSPAGDPARYLRAVSTGPSSDPSDGGEWR
ncbi:glycosyltransferase [Dactylosporangium sp. NPDC049140]|uniref:glycosyltransferase family 2 protein n=1 Tax=Dactylosporangium sp. NPDC049140 TaxID=3155647 RepID=UPI003410911E